MLTHLYKTDTIEENNGIPAKYHCMCYSKLVVIMSCRLTVNTRCVCIRVRLKKCVCAYVTTCVMVVVRWTRRVPCHNITT